MSNPQVVPKFAAKALEALQEVAQSKNRVFQGNGAVITTEMIERPLRASETFPIDSSTHFESYKEAAASAKERGNKDEESLYSFLRVLCSFWPDFADRQHPFRPMIQMEGRRTLVPEDLHPEDIDVVANLFKNASSHWLRARLGDVLWVLRRDHAAAREAAISYAAAAGRIADTDKGWSEAVTLFLRGLQLAMLLGRGRDPFNTVASQLESVTERLARDEGSFRSARLMDLLIQFGIGDASRWGGVAEAVASKLEAQKAEQRLIRAYLERAARWYSQAGQEEAASKAALSAGKTYIQEAEEALSKPKSFHGSAVHALRKAIQALRHAGAEEALIEQLKKRLLQIQQAGMAEMQTFSQEVDLRPAIEAAQENVTRRTFWSALIRFAFGYPMLKPSEVRQQVLDAAKESPLSSLLGTALVDVDGRVKHQIPGLPLTGGPEFETILQQHTFQHAARFSWPFRAQGYIEPGRFVIWNEHHPNLSDLEPLMVHNPFIPPGHEPFFLRGIHAGFVGDFLMASSFLVPQIEESLRYVLKNNNVDVSNLMEDDTQPVKLLGRLLGLEQTKVIFGESLQFELRGLLIEKAGFEFRNRVAHGFAKAADCYSDAAINTWWLVLQILLRPILTQADLDAVRQEVDGAS